MKPAIVFQTDFSRDSGAVAAMYGVCRSVDPEVALFDLTHGIPPFNIFAASHSLSEVADFWPRGTVFVSVVDPGVGTSRRGSVALLNNGSYVVTPDNGTLTHLHAQIGVNAIREIDMTVNRWPGTENCNIFHGRDVFAYTAARLASGIIDFAGVGPEYPPEKMVLIDYDAPASCGGALTGIIESAAPNFGLVFTNIPDKMFLGSGAEYGGFYDVKITRDGRAMYQERAEFQRSFGYVEIGAPLLFIGETGTVQLALRERNIVTLHGIGAGPDWRITLTKVRL